MRKSIVEISKGNEYVMYIIVNSDLKMGKGKIAAQVAHSACRVTRFLDSFSERPAYYQDWLNHSEPKIVLKTSEEKIRVILKEHCVDTDTDTEGLWCFHTIDAGRTQIPSGSLTTLAFRPMRRKNAPENIKSLKLL